MKLNLSNVDRSIRAASGFALITIALTVLNVLDGEILGIIFAAVGAVFVLTAACAFCPAYAVCGVSSRTKCCGGACKAESEPTDSPA